MLANQIRPENVDQSYLMLRKSCLLFTINGRPDAIVAQPRLQLTGGWGVLRVSGVGLAVVSEQSKRQCISRECDFQNQAARYSRFDSGDFASETVGVSAKLPWRQPASWIERKR